MSTSSLAVVATGLSVFALLVAVALAVQVGRLRRAAEARAVRAPAGLRAGDAAPRPREPRALTRVAVVRYDAFGDLAGALSFSAALLDDAGNGLVLSSINGRSETRTYAKGIAQGTSEHSLSPEEAEAVQRATLPADSAAPAKARRRLSRARA